jgi:hypothetical protein
MVGGRLLIFGGMTTRDPRANVIDTCALRDVQILDVERNLFLSSPTLLPLALPRSGSTLTLLGEDGAKLLVFGGMNSGNETLAAAAVLELGRFAQTSFAEEQ